MHPMQTTKQKTRTERETEAPQETPTRDERDQDLLDDIDDILDALDEVIDDSEAETEFIVTKAVEAEMRARDEDIRERMREAQEELLAQAQETGFYLLPCGC